MDYNKIINNEFQWFDNGNLIFKPINFDEHSGSTKEYGLRWIENAAQLVIDYKVIEDFRKEIGKIYEDVKSYNDGSYKDKINQLKSNFVTMLVKSSCLFDLKISPDKYSCVHGLINDDIEYTLKYKEHGKA